MGHYFASASHDRTARIWSVDRIQPLRIMAGHLSDVDVSTLLFTVPLPLCVCVYVCLEANYASRSASERAWLYVPYRHVMYITLSRLRSASS